MDARGMKINCNMETNGEPTTLKEFLIAQKPATGRQLCCPCRDMGLEIKSLSGLRKGHGMCQYHWDLKVFK